MHLLLTVTQPSDLSTDPEADSELPGRSSDALGVVNASWEMHSYRYRRCMFKTGSGLRCIHVKPGE